MTALAWGALFLGAVGTAFGIWQRTARQRMLRRLDRMLDRAISGGFVEDRF